MKYFFHSISICVTVENDPTESFLQVYNADGEFLFKFGSHGEGNGQFNAPTGVAVDANGNIIVADWGNSRIQVSFQEQKLTETEAWAIHTWVFLQNEFGCWMCKWT